MLVCSRTASNALPVRENSKMIGTRSWLQLTGIALAITTPVLAAPGTSPVYPEPPRANVVDTYWGTPVPDPFRPLENINAPDTQRWLGAQETITRSYLDGIAQRAPIRTEVARMFTPAPSATPLVHHGAYWTSTRYEPGRRPVTVVRSGADGPERTLFDANVLPANVTVAYYVWSRSGKSLAYATETNGSDWLTWHVRNVTTGVDLPDVVRWSKYVDASFEGDRGFCYSGYDAPASGNESDPTPPGSYKAFFHRLGTPQSSDVLVVAAPPNRFDATDVRNDGFAIEYIDGTNNLNGYDVFPADRPGAPRRTLIEPNDGTTRYVGNIGPRFFFRVSAAAPNGRVVEVDANDDAHHARTVVPERADPLVNATLIGDRLYLEFLHGVHSVIEIADLRGRPLGTIALPGAGTASIPEGNAEDGFAYYTYESFIDPPATFRYDLRAGTSTVAARQPIPFDPAPFVTDQLFATSKDGTGVPVFVTHRRDMRYDGSTPTRLWGYGGYGSTFTLTPTFGWSTAVWLEMGGAYAVVNARGGGEYGEAWHRAGMLEQKQHVFDDVIAAAQLLVDRKVTSPAKLALEGASEGGFMVGAVVMQRPELFAAAIPSAAGFDVLRAQKFNSEAAHASEIGSVDQSEAMFRTIYAYSPLHNVHDGTRYPAMLIVTGDHDDRVFPAHSYKFAAAVQHAQAGKAPILLDVALNAGHDYGVAGTAVDRTADRFAFLTETLNFTPAFSASSTTH
jgi:prolyl oligopeptidase